jgi:hypothetical protein
VTFRGDSIRLIGQFYLGAVPVLMIITFMSMGNFWFYPFLFYLGLSVPLILPVAFLSMFSNGFTFNDEERRITKKFTRGVPYEKVKAVIINEDGKTLSVSVKTGRLQRKILVWTLDSNEKKRLEEEIAKRFPHEILLQRKRSTLRMTALMTFVPFLLFSVCHGYLYHKHPEVRIVPQVKQWETTRNLSGGKDYTLKGISFFLPEGFQLAKTEERELMFERGVVTMVVYSNSSYEELLSKGRLSWIKINDIYDLYGATYYSRFGLVPLVLKSIALSGLREIRIYDIRHPTLKGFVVQGIKGMKETAQIILVDKKAGSGISFYISSPEKIPEEMLMSIVGSVRIL